MREGAGYGGLCYEGAGDVDLGAGYEGAGSEGVGCEGVGLGMSWATKGLKLGHVVCSSVTPKRKALPTCPIPQ